MTERRTSRIAGRGLFATRPVPAATVVSVTVDELNHSCDPNLGWAPSGGLRAMRDIAADEELTIDYALGLDDRDFVMMCHCETYRCRQIVEGNDWQIPQLQKRYAGYWAPAIQRRIDDTPR